MEPIRCPQTLVLIQPTLCNNSEDGRMLTVACDVCVCVCVCILLEIIVVVFFWGELISSEYVYIEKNQQVHEMINIETLKH